MEEQGLLWHWQRATGLERYGRSRFIGQVYTVEAADEERVQIRYVLERGEDPIVAADRLVRRLKTISHRVPIKPRLVRIHVVWKLKHGGALCEHDREYVYDEVVPDYVAP